MQESSSIDDDADVIPPPIDPMTNSFIDESTIGGGKAADEGQGSADPMTDSSIEMPVGDSYGAEGEVRVSNPMTDSFIDMNTQGGSDVMSRSFIEDSSTASAVSS